MRLSRQSHQRLESFFREYYSDDSLRLPEIEIFIKRGAGIVAKLAGVFGITFGRFMFIKPDLIFQVETNDLFISKKLMAHEATHVLQYKRLGWCRFFYTYLSSYWNALWKKEKWDFDSRMEAYLEIPHEVEARLCADKFIEWCEKTGNPSG
ncbi:MAG: hypothetical protein ACR2L1_00640 [Pyrinomonadaceae bacterium]